MHYLDSLKLLIQKLLDLRIFVSCLKTYNKTLQNVNKTLHDARQRSRPLRLPRIGFIHTGRRVDGNLHRPSVMKQFVNTGV